MLRYPKGIDRTITPKVIEHSPCSRIVCENGVSKTVYYDPLEDRSRYSNDMFKLETMVEAGIPLEFVMNPVNPSGVHVDSFIGDFEKNPAFVEPQKND